MLKKILACCSIAVLLAGCSLDQLNDRIDDLNDRLAAVEKTLQQLNKDVSALQELVQALDGGSVITDIRETADGYRITFSDGKTIDLRHGADGTSPVLGVGEENGTYYWTVTVNGKTDWMTDAEGNRIPVSVKAPVMGVDADGYWTVDYGDGPVRITGPDGKPVPAEGTADSFFSDVTYDENSVTVTLKDGTVLVLPRSAGIEFRVEAEPVEYFSAGQTREFRITAGTYTEIAVSKPDGWRVSIEGETLSVTAAEKENMYAERSGRISFTVLNGKNTAIFHQEVVSLQAIAGFEQVPEGMTAIDAYGSNLYSEYEGEQLISCTDPESGLVLHTCGFEELGYEMYLGSTFLSRWNEMTDGTYSNQCSVYYADPATGKGGRNGSATFGVSYGYKAMLGYGPDIHFEQEGYEAVIDHFYVTNSTYAYISMSQGDGFAKKFTYEDGDWFKLTVTGYNAAGTQTGTVDFYLADFRTPDAPGILSEWTRVDLSSLGAVHKLEFDLSSSDTGQWGMNTPGYFCFDDIAIAW